MDQGYDGPERRDPNRMMYRLLFDRPVDNRGLPASLAGRVEIKEGAGAVAFCPRCHYVINEDIGRDLLLANLEGHVVAHERVCRDGRRDVYG